MDKFKKGDKVKVMSLRGGDSCVNIEIGDEGIVNSIGGLGIPIVRFENNVMRTMYEEQLEFIKEDNMNLKDLLVPGETIVECRDGDIGLVVKTQSGLRILFQDISMSADNLNEDLTEVHGVNSCDLIKISKLSNVTRLKGVLKHGLIVWKRKETKTITIDGKDIEISKESFEAFKELLKE